MFNLKFFNYEIFIVFDCRHFSHRLDSWFFRIQCGGTYTHIVGFSSRIRTVEAYWR